MDILYLSSQARQELTQYCESELILFVLEHFSINGKIIEKKTMNSLLVGGLSRTILPTKPLIIGINFQSYYLWPV